MCHQTLSRLEHCGCVNARLLRPYNSKYSLVTPISRAVWSQLSVYLPTSPHKEMYIINRNNYNILYLLHTYTVKNSVLQCTLNLTHRDVLALNYTF